MEALGPPTCWVAVSDLEVLQILEFRLYPHLPAAHRDLFTLRPQDLRHDCLARGAEGEAAAHRAVAG